MDNFVAPHWAALGMVKDLDEYKGFVIVNKTLFALGTEGDVHKLSLQDSYEQDGFCDEIWVWIQKVQEKFRRIKKIEEGKKTQKFEETEKNKETKKIEETKKALKADKINTLYGNNKFFFIGTKTGKLFKFDPTSDKVKKGKNLNTRFTIIGAEENNESRVVVCLLPNLNIKIINSVTMEELWTSNFRYIGNSECLKLTNDMIILSDSKVRNKNFFGSKELFANFENPKKLKNFKNSKTVRVFSIQDPEASNYPLITTKYKVLCLAVFCGKIAVGTLHHKIYLYNESSTDPVHAFTHISNTTTLAFESEKTLFSGHSNGSVYIWDLENKVLMLEIFAHQTAVSKIFLLEKNQFYSVSYFQIKFWVLKIKL